MQSTVAAVLMQKLLLQMLLQMLLQLLLQLHTLLNMKFSLFYRIWSIKSMEKKINIGTEIIDETAAPATTGAKHLFWAVVLVGVDVLWLVIPHGRILLKKSLHSLIWT